MDLMRERCSCCHVEVWKCLKLVRCVVWRWIASVL